MLFKKKKTKKGKGKSKTKSSGQSQGSSQAHAAKAKELQEKETKLAELEGQLKSRHAQIEEWKANLENKEKHLEEKLREIEEKAAALAEAPEPGEGGIKIPDKAPRDEWEKVIAEIKAVLAEATAKLEEAKEVEASVEAFRNRVEEFRSEGYNVSRLEAAGEELMPEAYQEFITKFEEDIGVLKIFEEKLEGLKDLIEEDDLKELETMLKDPELVEAVQAKLSDIETSMASQKEMFEEKLALWRSEGFDVSRLEEIMDHDIKAIVNEFKQFESKLDQAKVVLQKLESLDPMFADEIEELKGKAKYLDLLEEVETKVAELEEKEEEKKVFFLEKHKQWQEEGYDVSRLENISSGNLAAIQAEFDNYQKDIDRLEDLARRLNKIKHPKAKKLVPYLKRPDEVARLEKAIIKLESLTKKPEPEPEARART